MHQWMIAIMVATLEAAIRRVVAGSLPWQIVGQTLSQKYQTQKGLTEWLKR
jgi:hypothetical protein